MAYLHKSISTGIYSARIKGLKNQKTKEKSITLMTDNKALAKKRLEQVNKMSKKIKNRFHSRAEIYSMFDWLDESDINYNSEANRAANSFSYVYIINAEGTNNYKIGKANCTQERVSHLQVGAWRKLIIVYSFKFDNDYVFLVENSIHKSLAPLICKSKNEWFCLTKKQLDCLSDILKGYYDFYSSIKPLRQLKENEPKEERESNPADRNRGYNDKRKEWYQWKKRAEKAGVPLLPSHRPSKSTINNWKQSIRAIENVLV